MFAKLAITIATLLLSGSSLHLALKPVSLVDPQPSTVSTQTFAHTTSDNDSHNNPQPLSPAYTTQLITETQAIPYGTTTIVDPGLALGQSVIKTAGVAGIETITYRATYLSGKEISRQQLSVTVTTPPVTEVIAVGNTFHHPCPMYVPPTDGGGAPSCSPGPVRLN